MRRAGLLAVAILASCARTKPLPVYGQVPSFVLTAQTGERFDSRRLAGKIWVADFMFTTCLGPCPRMASQMLWVDRQVKDLADVRLVSFTIDPGHDTPAVLAEYAGRFQADASRWSFLTGSQSVLQLLDRDAFKLGDVDGTLTHSTRFVLVDRHGRIRGYYDSGEEGGLNPLVSEIRRLARESM